MKQVIIALTAASVMLVASASLAQDNVSTLSSPHQGSPMSPHKLTIKVEGNGAVLNKGMGSPQEVMINGTSYKIAAGSRELVKSGTLTAADADRLMISYNGVSCPRTGHVSGLSDHANGHISKITLKLSDKEVNGSKRTVCDSMVEVSK